MFISLNLFYEYYVHFDWCRKVPRRLHACSTLVFGPQVHPPPLRATGLFFPAVGWRQTAGKNSPGVSSPPRSTREGVSQMRPGLLWGSRARGYSYPEMCAEHVVPRSASAPALSVSTFFIIFFSKYARALSIRMRI